MTFLIPQFPELTLRNYFGVFDDFGHYVTADAFTTIATDSGTIVDGDGAGGTVLISASDGTVANNDEAYLKGTHEIFKFAADKPLVFEARVQGIQATAFGEINMIVGVMDGVAANSLLDDGGGPDASYSGALFFKVDGGTYWNCESSIAGAQTTVLLTKHAPATATYQTLRIEYRPINATTGEVHFYIDGEEVGLKTSGKQFVAHTVTFASATEMQIVLGTKGGADTNGCQLKVDYVGCWQKR